MAIKFNEIAGQAKKGVDNLYRYKEGENIVRLVGEVLPRYLYWLKGTNGKDVPFECLSFDREAEKFTNVETDYVREYFPDAKCQWSYSAQIINVPENRLEVINLKKKLFQQIKSLAEDLGDPTDPDTGWIINFKKEKTGPLAYNVEYTLNQIRCKKVPLTAEQRELLKSVKPMDEIYPRTTPETQKQLLENLTADLNKNKNAEPVQEEEDLPM